MQADQDFQRYSEMIKQFQLQSHNQSYALNFVLGVVGGYVKRGNVMTTQNLIDMCEGALRFSKVRK